MYRFVKIIWIWCMGFYELYLLVSQSVYMWAGMLFVHLGGWWCVGWCEVFGRLWIPHHHQTAEFRSNWDPINFQENTHTNRSGKSGSCASLLVDVSMRMSMPVHSHTHTQKKYHIPSREDKTWESDTEPENAACISHLHTFTVHSLFPPSDPAKALVLSVFLVFFYEFLLSLPPSLCQHPQ